MDEKKEKVELQYQMPEPPKEIIPPKKLSLNESINLLTEKFEMYEQKGASKTKDKKFKLPSKMKKAAKGFVKENKVLILYNQTNTTSVLKIAKINNGFVYINGKIHVATPEFVLRLEGKTPFMIINEWDLNPIGTKQYYEALASGRGADPQTTIIRAIEEYKQLEKTSKTMNMKAIIIIGMGILVAGYVLFGQG